MVTKEELKSIMTEEDFSYASELIDESGHATFGLAAELLGIDPIMTIDEIKEHVNVRKTMDAYRKNPYTGKCGISLESI